MEYISEQGFVQDPYKQSTFYRMYVDSPMEWKTIPSMMKDCRNRFRVPL